MKLILCLAFLLVTQSLGAPDGKRDWMKTLGARAKPEIRMPRLRTEDGKLNIDSRIVGGVEATPHEFPWAVSIEMDNSYACTGSLISNQWILTAGHCVAEFSSFEVLLGAHDINDPNVQTMTSRKKILHKNYDDVNIQNDIGLIELPQDITFNDKIAAIKLNDNASIPAEGDYVTAAGWGRYSDGIPSISPVLRKVQVPVMPEAKCADIYGSESVGPGNICIDSTGGHGTCNGDSGGPLMKKLDSGEFVLVGITSYGAAAGCEEGYPDVFTRVSYFNDWIQQNTGGV